MLCLEKDTCLTREVGMEQVHLTPIILVCGKFHFFPFFFVVFFFFGMVLCFLQNLPLFSFLITQFRCYHSIKWMLSVFISLIGMG